MDDYKNRQDSQKTLTFQDVPASEGTHIALKPRRRLMETAADRADGLDFLIQKTRSIGLQPGEDPLVFNINRDLMRMEMNGLNLLTKIDSLNHRGEKLLWGVRKIRKYVCGGLNDLSQKVATRMHKS